MKTYLDAKRVKTQHKKPCDDCPFARGAIPGWLADKTPAEYVMLAHLEGTIECHTRKQLTGEQHHQCAGAAIYRANVCKRVVAPEVLVLPPSRKTVFASPGEFIEYHMKRKVPDAEMRTLTAAALARLINPKETDDE